MLRLLVLLLLVANLAFFAWAQGWLGSEATEAVPPRTEVEADHVVVLPRHPIAALQAATTPATTPASSVDQAAICIEAGPFNDEEFADVEQRVRQVLPGLAWATVTRASPAQWAVYMGPFASEEQLDRKQEELRRMDDLRFEVLRSPASLAPGISLGRHEQEAAAQAALVQFRQRGIRTARVVQVRAAIERRLMRVAQADSKAQLALSGLDLPRGQTFTACRF